MNKQYLVIILLVFLILSCDQHKKPLSFYDYSELNEDSVEFSNDQYDTMIALHSTESISVPFIEQNGVKLIDVMVNQKITVKMVLDSGCSTTLISMAEANYLYEKGDITQDDILGITQSQIADGSLMENMVINLRELTIGGKIVCTNVTAVVSANTQAPLLLGNEILNRVPSYSVDNQNKVLIFNLGE